MLNVNADTLAAHVAAGIGASELLLVGGTAGVLDGAGRDDRGADAAPRPRR